MKIFPAQGLSNEKLSLSITIGILSGIFPVIGGTTVIGLLLLATLRQNLATVQSLNWLMAPFQLISIIPFMRFGAWFLQVKAAPITLYQIKLAFNPGVLTGLKTLGVFHLYAVLGWILISIPTGIIIYFILLYIFQLKSRTKGPK